MFRHASLNTMAKRKQMRFMLQKTQAQIAEKFGVSRNFYSMWENGLRKSSKLDNKLNTLYQRHKAA